MSRRRSRSANIVGVAIDGDVIRGTQLRRGFGRTRVVRCAEVAIPAEVTDHGRIVDEAGFVAALQDLWAAGGFGTKHVAFGIDGRDATFRRLEIPTGAGDLVEDAARCELAAVLPYDIDDAITVVHEVERRADAVDVVAVAVRRTTVETIADAVTSAGLRLRDLTLAPTALGLGVAGSSREHTIVSVDRVTTTIVVHRAGKATVTRVLTGGGGERSTEVADELEQALASVDQFRQGGVVEGTAAPTPRVRRFRTVVDEVAAAIRFEESQAGTGRMVGVELTGAYGADELLASMMDDGVEATVAVAEPPDWWQTTEPFATFATTAGVALNAFDGQSGLVHLDPPSLVDRNRRRLELAVGVAGAAVLALGGAHYVDSAAAEEAAAVSGAVDAEVRAEVVAAQLDAMTDLAALQDEVEDRARIVEDAVTDEIWWPRVLDEVATAMPDETFLTGLTLRRPLAENAIGDGDEDATATFAAIALDQAGAAEWLLAVESLDLLEDVWLLQSTASVYGELELPVVAFVSEGALTDAARSPRALGVDPGSEDAS